MTKDRLAKKRCYLDLSASQIGVREATRQQSLPQDLQKGKRGRREIVQQRSQCPEVELLQCRLLGLCDTITGAGLGLFGGMLSTVDDSWLSSDLHLVQLDFRRLGNHIAR